MSSGIIRRIDQLGRCVIPKEFRTLLNLDPEDEVEITCQGDVLTISPCKHHVCATCGKSFHQTYHFCPYCGKQFMKR